VVGIRYTGPTAPSLEEQDTLTLTAVALDIDGNVLAEVPVIWRVLEPDTVVLPFTLDSLTGLVTGIFAGPGRVQGIADGLRTSTITVTVLAVPDSIAGVEPTTVTVDELETESPALVAVVYDVSLTGQATGIPGRSVRFSIVEPAPGTPAASQVAIGLPGQPVGADSLTVTARSGAGGLALATARRAGGVQPDSAIVEAVALTSAGGVIPGTPARFVVRFITN
jgi:hypothetical protein